MRKTKKKKNIKGNGSNLEGARGLETAGAETKCRVCGGIATEEEEEEEDTGRECCRRVFFAVLFFLPLLLSVGKLCVFTHPHTHTTYHIRIRIPHTTYNHCNSKSESGRVKTSVLQILTVWPRSGIKMF